jgi:hypothetical protein
MWIEPIVDEEHKEGIPLSCGNIESVELLGCGGDGIDHRLKSIGILKKGKLGEFPEVGKGQLPGFLIPVMEGLVG